MLGTFHSGFWKVEGEGGIPIFSSKKSTKFGPVGHLFKGTDKKSKLSDFFFKWIPTKN